VYVVGDAAGRVEVPGGTDHCQGRSRTQWGTVEVWNNVPTRSGRCRAAGEEYDGGKLGTGDQSVAAAAR